MTTSPGGHYNLKFQIYQQIFLVEMDLKIFPQNERRVKKAEAINLISKQDYRRMIFLTGAMNSGKTHTIIEAIEDDKDCKSVLFIVGRISLVLEIQERMRTVFDVYSYTDKLKFTDGILRAKTGRLELKSVFVTCINSLLKMPLEGMKFDMVVVDEVTLTMGNLIAYNFIKQSEGEEILQCIKNTLLPKTKTTVLMDAAFPEPLKEDFINMINIDPDVDPARIYDLRLYREDVDPIFHTAYFYQAKKYEVETKPTDREGLIMREILHTIYVERKKVSISCPWAESACQMRNFILAARPDSDRRVPHIICLTADEKSMREQRVKSGYTDETLDLHVLVAEADVVIFNSCISAGHSFDTKGVAKHFSFMAFNNHSCSLLEYMQMTARFRNVETGTIHICTMDVNKKSGNKQTYHQELHNFCTKMKEWESEITSSYSINKTHIERALNRSFRGIVSEKGKIRKIKPKKNKLAIQAKYALDQKELKKLITLEDFPNKWELFMKGKNYISGIYSRNIPKDVLDKNNINYRQTFSGEYYIIAS